MQETVQECLHPVKQLKLVSCEFITIELKLQESQNQYFLLHYKIVQVTAQILLPLPLVLLFLLLLALEVAVRVTVSKKTVYHFNR